MAHKHPTFELRVRKVHCYDVNDGFLNGHKDHIYLWEHLSGIDTGRARDLGKFKNGWHRKYRNKLIMKPAWPSSFVFKMMEKDKENFSGDDHVGGFSVDENGKITPGKDTSFRTPPQGTPKAVTYLLMTGSGAKYELQLTLRALPST